MNDEESRDPAVRAAFLTEEVFVAVRLIEEGLGYLQRISPANDFYHAPMQLLASGIERLLKCAIAYGVIARTGMFPEKEDIEHTHAVTPLLGRVIREAFDEEYLKRPAAREDLEFIRNDQVLAAILRTLGYFGDTGRYWNLNITMGKGHAIPSPETEWAAMELIVADELDVAIMTLDPEGLRAFYERLNKRLTEVIERFVRGISRLFTLSNIAEQAKVVTAHIGPFLYLTDEALGTREYGHG